MISKFSMRIFLFCALLALWVGAASGQDVPRVVETRVALATDGVHAGSGARAAVIAQVTSGYHINDHHPSLDYLIPTEVKFDPSELVSVTRVVYPKGQLAKFAFSDEKLSVYEGEVPIGVILKVSRSVVPRTITVRGKLTYQACNDHACLPPQRVPLSLTLRVVPRSVRLRAENSGVFSKINFK